MTWVRATGGISPRWVKWLDREAITGWLAVMRAELARTDDPATLPEAEQYARTVVLFEAIRGFALACDLSPLALSPYAMARLAGDVGEKDYPTIYTEFGTWRAETFATVQRVSEVVREAVNDGDPVSLTIFLRVDFNASGDVVQIRNPPQTERGHDRYLSSTGSVNTAWSSTLWSEWAPGALSASSEVYVAATLPLSTSYDLARRVCRIITTLDVDEVLSQTQIWVAAKNARLSKVLGGELPEDIVNAAAALDVQRGGGDGPTPAMRTVAATIAAVVTAIAGPVGAAVMGVLLGLAEALYRVVPRAVAYAVDVWGRTQPFLESISYTGTLAPERAPTHAVPPPPPADGAPTVSTVFAGIPLFTFVPKKKPKTSPAVIGLGLYALVKLVGG